MCVRIRALVGPRKRAPFTNAKSVLLLPLSTKLAESSRIIRGDSAIKREEGAGREREGIAESPQIIRQDSAIGRGRRLAAEDGRGGRRWRVAA